MVSALLLVVAGPAAAEVKTDPQRTHGVGYGEPDTARGVLAVQLQLRKAGARPGPIDGRMGRRTVAAVRRFQRGEGLAVDGVVGPLTAGALRRPEALAVPGSGITRPKGSRRVRVLQWRLRRAGVRPGPVDGRYGPMTEAAVRRFQRREDLRVDGRFDKATAVALAKRGATGTRRESMRGGAAGQGPSGRSSSQPDATPPARAGAGDARGAGQAGERAGADDSGSGGRWLLLVAVIPLLGALAAVVRFGVRHGGRKAPPAADADAGRNGDDGYVRGPIPHPVGSNGSVAVTEFPMLAPDELQPASVPEREASPWVIPAAGQLAERPSSAVSTLAAPARESNGGQPVEWPKPWTNGGEPAERSGTKGGEPAKRVESEPANIWPDTTQATREPASSRERAAGSSKPVGSNGGPSGAPAPQWRPPARPRSSSIELPLRGGTALERAGEPLAAAVGRVRQSAGAREATQQVTAAIGRLRAAGRARWKGGRP